MPDIWLLWAFHGSSDDLAGDRTAAGLAWKQALAIFDDIGHTEADRMRARLRR
jgi:hypothetical protein